MGWIAVVQHGEGVSKKLRWWLSALVGGAGRGRARARRARPFRLLARPRADHVRALSLRLRGRIMVARLGGFAQRAAGLTCSMSRPASPRHCHGLLTGPGYGPRTAIGRRECSKTVLPLSSTAPNMLKKRVLLSSGEFHSGSKRATRGAREQRSVGGVRASSRRRMDRNSRCRCWKQYAGRSRFCARSKSCTSSGL